MAGVRGSPVAPSEARTLGSRAAIVMTMKDGRMGVRGSSQPQSRESQSGDAIERAIGETIQRDPEHEPAPRAYARAISAAQQRSAPGRDGSALRSWIVAVASATAALLLVNIAIHFFGVVAVRARLRLDGRTGPFLLWLSSTRPCPMDLTSPKPCSATPGVLFLHTLGLAMAVGASVVVNLRCSVPRPDLRRGIASGIPLHVDWVHCERVVGSHAVRGRCAKEGGQSIVRVQTGTDRSRHSIDGDDGAPPFEIAVRRGARRVGKTADQACHRFASDLDGGHRGWPACRLYVLRTPQWSLFTPSRSGSRARICPGW